MVVYNNVHCKHSIITYIDLYGYNNKQWLKMYAAYNII